MQENKNNRSFKIITVIALCVAVICLSVAYATLSQSLKISGTTTVEKATWDIHLEKRKENDGDETEGYSKVGGATVSYNIVSTTITDLVVTLTKPGDKATIELNAVNKGDIDAVLKSVTELNISCTGNGSKADEDKKLICGENNDGKNGNVKVSVKYDDQDVTTGILPAEHTKLEATNGVKPIDIVIEYDATKTAALPEAVVTVNLGDLAFAYEQDGVA